MESLLLEGRILLQNALFLTVWREPVSSQSQWEM